MSVLMRAVQANMEASDLQEKNMNRHIAKKEGDNEKLKKMNGLLDRLTEMRADNMLYQDECKELISSARELGIDLSMNDFTEINDAYEKGHSGAMLDPKKGFDDEDDAAEMDDEWGKARREELDKVAQKFERAIKAEEDESGSTSLHLNLSMNKYTQKLQDANGVVSSIKDLEGALTLRA